MITLNRNAASAAAFPLAKSSSDTSASSQKFDNSFTQQLVSALEGYLSQNQNASHVEISIDAQPGQNSGARQFLVTVRDTPPAVTAAPSAASLSPTPTPAATATPEPPDTHMSMMYSGTPVVAPKAAETADPGPQNEADAYWATQPKEVQELRTIPDFQQRRVKAQELADKGFSIDSDIMVWGDDPYITMRYRQDMGYTWTPSIGQASIPVAPGLKFPGLPSYDPSQPPAGSIAVTTAFAKGLESTIPWGGVAWIKST